MKLLSTFLIIGVLSKIFAYKNNFIPTKKIEKCIDNSIKGNKYGL